MHSEASGLKHYTKLERCFGPRCHFSRKMIHGQYPIMLFRFRFNIISLGAILTFRARFHSLCLPGFAVYFLVARLAEAKKGYLHNLRFGTLSYCFLVHTIALLGLFSLWRIVCLRLADLSDSLDLTLLSLNLTCWSWKISVDFVCLIAPISAVLIRLPKKEKPKENKQTLLIYFLRLLQYFAYFLVLNLWAVCPTWDGTCIPGRGR